MIAVVVLGLGGWAWPRVDQRFVGKWHLHYGSDDKEHSPVVSLTSWGGGSMVVEPDDEFAFEHGPPRFYWCVVGNKFLMSESKWPLLPQVELAWYRATGKFPGVAEVGYLFIIKASPDELVLDGMESWDGKDREWREGIDGPAFSRYARVAE